MPHWMRSEHGIIPAYDVGEMDRLKTLGWSFMNTGESPDYSAKVEPAAVKWSNSAEPGDIPASWEIAEPAVKTLHEQLDEPVEPVKDLLDQTVVEIEQQLGGLTKQELEALRAQEVAGKTRKGLLSIIDARLKP